MPTGDADFIRAYLTESVEALTAFQSEPAYRQTMTAMADSIVTALRAGRKLLIAGNGGSAGDSQHIAGEFISRLMYDRAPLAAIALTVDTSVITATGNDYGYEHIFERQILGLGQTGDVFLGISTSGKSPNIIRAFDASRDRGLISIGFCGAVGGPMRDRCRHLLEAPSGKTAIIQQIHIVAAHIVCALVERAMFPRDAA
ncbi:D-sedoheptulose 7-phosphate isomerase [Acidisphaera sp. S103]|uniref:D-sedoheptulose 7-phosphate isomerase n=1 Tax=Acidisphaera sp. S103 TaxID=1747223 RepID=UPI00131E417D|nr:D-sedoheptulose 7-phosphate isomerase [Acidisphaera sp. S103]